MKTRTATVALLGAWLTLTSPSYVVRADDRPADAILKDLDAAERPKFDREHARDEAAVRAYSQAIRKYAQERNRLIVELLKSQPDHPRLVELLPERWADPAVTFLNRPEDLVKEADQATRDRIGEIVFRFYFGCMYRHRQFSGDPHPGNFLLRPDGSVAFLDFGLFKVMPEELIKIELACQRAGHEGDGEKLKQIFTETGFLGQPDRFRPDKLLAQFLDATWWYVLDEEVQLEPEIATQVMIDMSDPRSAHFGQMRHETLPADHLFGRRVEMLTLAVLSQLRARGNFHRVAREWMYDDPPVTELGREEAAFWAGR